MTTITIATNVTMTLTDKTARKWFEYKKAVERRNLAYRNSELDWEDLEDFDIEVWEAWDSFCS